ncbi:MAG: hypothetical protein HY242_04385 [Afipia sp.]|nr:hypothetical protein [Afipia sp.]
MRRTGELGLFANVRETVDQALNVRNYATRSAPKGLTEKGYTPDTATLVPALFEVIQRNWNAAIQAGQRSPSTENFRWHCPQIKIADQNTSAEVTFERALIRALLKAGRNDWSNQVPLISGVAGPHAFKKRAVDLVHRSGKDAFEFVELKIDSDTPVYAAVEILVYGLLWFLSRRDRSALSYPAGPLLDASELKLSVLAPRDYYGSYSLGPLAKAINDGVLKLGEQHGVTMSFRFTAFPEAFFWPRELGAPSDLDLIGLLDARKTV